MKRWHQKKFNLIIVMLDIALAFVFSFSIIGMLVLDSQMRATNDLVSFSSGRVAGIEEADFDPGIEVDGELDNVSRKKLRSLFDNLQ